MTAPTQRRIAGIKTKRGRRGEARDATTWHGIPVTTVPRTLVDLASVLSLDDLARACHEAGVKHGTTPRHVEAVLARRPRSAGAKNLRRVLRGDAHVTLSGLERRFLERLREAGLPLPETNRPAAGRRVDCRWPGHRLTVELDSYRYHHSRHAWEQDRLREREARARGDEFRRYTHDDVFVAPRFMLSELCPARSRLARSAPGIRTAPGLANQELEMPNRLEGKRVAFVATDGVEHLDKDQRFKVDTTVADASAEDYDGLVLPGGVANAGLVSSRTPDDLPAFCDKLVEEICEGRHDQQALQTVGSGS